MAKATQGRITGKVVTTRIPSPAGGVRMETFIPWTLVKRGVRHEIITPIAAPQAFREEVRVERQEQESGQHSLLLRTLGLAHYWQKLLDDGKFRSITEIAEAEGMDVGQLSRMGRLTQLAPDIIENCLAGGYRSPIPDQLGRYHLPVEWSAQRARGIAPGESDVDAIGVSVFPSENLSAKKVYGTRSA